MRSKPENVLNTNKVKETKNSFLLLQTKAKVSLPKRNVPAVTQRNTSLKTALTGRKFVVSAKSRAILRLLEQEKTEAKRCKYNRGRMSKCPD